MVVVLFALCGLGGFIWYKNVEGGIERTDPFSALTKGRPPKTVGGHAEHPAGGHRFRRPRFAGR